MTSQIQDSPDLSLQSSSNKLKKTKAVATRQFKLISVNFKEAALDSPSFRATVNHLDLQIENVEQWLIALTSSCRKIPKILNDVQSFYNSFLEHLVPSFLQDGLIDQEYTVQSLQTSLAGLKRLWGFSLHALHVNAVAIENLNSVISSTIAHYKELRKKYDLSQAKYERFLKTFVSTSKSKEAALVLEDANQLYTTKQEYIHCCLDLIMELATLGDTLDGLLVKVSTSLWNNKRMTLSQSQDLYFEEAWTKIQKIQAWSDSYSVAMDKLKSDMVSARFQVEESTKLQMRPSTNLNDYKSSLLNANVLADIDEPSFEKHGYLFLKTWTQNGSLIWVRRWVFIKGGVFGMLVLSPSRTFVQETDKIGVLLCNVKYYPSEDRRFCFEIKTKDFSFILQAETLIELKSWLKVFENEQTRILNSSNTDKELFNIASARYPPIIAEFASTINTTLDKELTNLKTNNALGQVIVSSNLSSHINKHEKYFQNHIYNQIPLIRPPFMTGTTKTSIIAYSLTAPTAIPNALTANIWGSVNWGIYYLHDSMERNITEKMLSEEYELPYIEKKSGAEPGIDYPDYYPKDLVPLDIQMRALFETAVDPDDYCLVSFRCIWSPNSKQELSGRCFITSHHIYFYMLALGFVALFKDPVSHMVSVECTSQNQYDQLKIYNVNGVIKLKLFLDDGKLIQEKLIHLINNGTRDNPKPLPDLISELSKIEVRMKEEKKDKQQLKLIENLGKTVKNKESLVGILENFETNPLQAGILLSLEFSNSESVLFETNFESEYQYCFEGKFNMPPKAIFHILLGDNAYFLNEQASLAKSTSLIKEPWRKSDDGKLFRSFNTTGIAYKKKFHVHVEHLIENMYNDEYYTFTQKESLFKFFLGSDFSVDFKFVIVGISAKQSKVFFYGRRTFNQKLIYNGFIDFLCHTLAYNKGNTFMKKLGLIEKKIGEHGMVAKAIYLYGKLSVTTAEQGKDDVIINYCSLIDALAVIADNISRSIFKFLVYFIKILIRGAFLFLKNVKMNYVLVLFCIISMMTNLFLVGRSSVSYWSVKTSQNVIFDYINNEPIMMKRAIYLQDAIDMLEKYQFLDEQCLQPSKCFNKFKNQSFVINYDRLSPWNTTYGDESTKSMGKKLRQSMWEIGVKRHDLMVQLKSLTSIEKELGLAEWKNWLMSEINRCLFVKSTIFNQVNDTLGSREISDELGAGMADIMNYCNDCTEQLYNIGLL